MGWERRVWDSQGYSRQPLIHLFLLMTTCLHNTMARDPFISLLNSRLPRQLIKANSKLIANN